MRNTIGRMKGGLILRGKAPGVWYGMIKADGKWKWHRIGKMGREDAEKKRQDIQDQVEGNYGRSIRAISFRELAEKWIKTQSLGNKPRTIDSYTDQLRCHLNPFFGDKQVDKIFPDTIEEFKLAMASKVAKIPAKKPKKEEMEASAPSPVIRNLSNTTINYNLRILRAILEAGVKWGHLSQNPAKMVSRLKQKKVHFEILDKNEISAVLNAIENPQNKLFIKMLALSGLRLGECLAMKWHNLDLKAHCYHVRESFSEFGFDSPKTDNSSRKVILDEALLQELKDHRVTQWKRQSELKDIYKDQGLVFTTDFGTPLNKSNLTTRVYMPALKEAKITKHVRFHDLRGTYISMCAEAGLSIKFIMDQVGHKDPRVTLAIYAQVTDAKKLEEAAKLSAYVFGAPAVKAV